MKVYAVGGSGNKTGGGGRNARQNQQTAPAQTRGGVRATLGRAATGARNALNRMIRPRGRNR